MEDNDRLCINCNKEYIEQRTSDYIIQYCPNCGYENKIPAYITPKKRKNPKK